MQSSMVLNIIQYRDFYDLPQIFLAQHQNGQILFESCFDDVLDDFESEFSLYWMKDLSESEMKGDWRNISSQARKLIGKYPKDFFRFDATRRASVIIVNENCIADILSV